jgi:two-component system nitrogen regulation response regulator GlnG
LSASDSDDSATLTVGPGDSLSGSALPRFPALTIACHPNAARVGTLAPLLIDGKAAVLNRDEPLFFTPGSSAGRGVDHRGISRDPVLAIQPTGKGGLEMRRLSPTAHIELNGRPFAGVRPLTADELAAGLVLTVAHQFVFILHTVHFPVTRSPPLGLLGAGDAIEDVRRTIARVADLRAPVLIRGESGTGKELVASALHATSRRREKPFVAVNVASLRPERAAADLFGYEKGAYTGAAQSHEGYFRAAHGGTLFLDEIGDLPASVHTTLLRVLTDYKVQPLGASAPRQVDVRIVLATDVKLQEEVAARRFDNALYNRLSSGLAISIPPLRERREDIGLLLIAFLRKHLSEIGQSSRLDEPAPDTAHWLSARAVAAICLFPWPGNVLALSGLAQRLAVESTDPKFKCFEFVTADLKEQLATLPQKPASDVTDDGILDALDQAGWNISRAAKLLGRNKSSLSRRLAKDPAVQLLAKLTVAELQSRLQAVGGDRRALAAQLGVAESLLARRLRAGS